MRVFIFILTHVVCMNVHMHVCTSIMCCCLRSLLERPGKDPFRRHQSCSFPACQWPYGLLGGKRANRYSWVFWLTKGSKYIHRPYIEHKVRMQQRLHGPVTCPEGTDVIS